MPIGCPETSAIKYRYSLCNNPEERSFHPPRGGSPKSPRVVLLKCQWCVCNEMSSQRNHVKKLFNSYCSCQAVMRLTPGPRYVGAVVAGVVHRRFIVAAGVRVSSDDAFRLHIYSTCVWVWRNVAVHFIVPLLIRDLICCDLCIHFSLSIHIFAIKWCTKTNYSKPNYLITIHW